MHSLGLRMGSERQRMKLVQRKTSYYRPGFASLYSNIPSSFMIFLYPPKFCEAVFVCFSSKIEQVSGGVGFNLKEVCSDSLRFLPLEQIVYHVQDGSAKPYVYVKSMVEFKSEGGNPDILKVEVLNDFDNEDIGQQQSVSIEISRKDKQILLLTSSPYCQTGFYGDGGSLRGSVVKTEPKADLSQFFKGIEGSRDTPYIISGTMAGSSLKSAGKTSKIYANMKQEQESQEICCPSDLDYSDFMGDENWSEQSAKPIANEYFIRKQENSQCKKDEKSRTSPLQAISINMATCDWMRICFDKGSKWCDAEGNALNLLFIHEVFIPTDSDEAIMFGIAKDDMNELRINFMMKEPAVQLQYGFIGSQPVITHTMHLKSYQEVGYDPSKLTLHVLKSKNCRARIHSVSYSA
ncbi:hypothetical protein RB195_007346 [Necator americanus]|uniref:Uncharacterized protein n=1 Tax=Necator americanus TaxID=51031 RepID=A0ABR1BYH1_NECAM